MDRRNILIVIAILAIIIIVIIWLSRSKSSHTNPEVEKFTEETVPSSQNTAGPKDNTNELVLYYATWCGYSRMFLPQWEEFTTYAKANLPQLKITPIRCEDGNESVCTQKGVQGYPTVILYLANGQEITFAGDRTKDGLVTFVSKYL